MLPIGDEAIIESVMVFAIVISTPESTNLRLADKPKVLISDTPVVTPVKPVLSRS